jgi:hypothetical protein
MTKFAMLVFASLFALGCSASNQEVTDPSDYLVPEAALPAQPDYDAQLRTPRFAFKDSTGFFSETHGSEYLGLPSSPYPSFGEVPSPMAIAVAGTGVVLYVDAVGVPTDGSLDLVAALPQLCPVPAEGGGVLLGSRSMSDDSWAERGHEVVRGQDDGSSILYRGVCRLQRTKERPDLVIRLVGEWPYLANDVMRRRIDLLSESLDIRLGD